MSRPIVGVAADLAAVAGGSRRRVFAYDTYLAALDAAGLDTVILSPTIGDAGRLLRQIDGVLIPGGDDLDPALWGEAPVAGSILSADERTSGDLTLVRMARGERIPFLGVCLGMQTLNVACGGSLIQDLTGESGSTVRHQGDGKGHSLVSHDIHIVAGTILAGLVGMQTAGVQSSHHQAPRRIGSGLVVSARSDDGVTEALEDPAQPFCLGVNWHPEEDRASALSKRLLAGFSTACHARRLRR